MNDERKEYSDDSNDSLSNKVLRGYEEHKNKAKLFIILSFFLLIVLVLFSVSIGSANIPISDVVSAVFGNAEGSLHRIIWYVRIPEVLVAIVAGAGLSVAGVVMQSTLRNPIGSPYTLGISHAAAFGAAFSVIVLGAGTTHSSGQDAVLINNPYLITIFAFIFSLVSMSIMIVLAKWRRTTPATMILTGVALGSMFTAGYTALQYFASQTELASVVFWTFGDVRRATWRDLGIMTAAVVPSFVYFVNRSWDYNVMDSGDESAISLGVDVERLRLCGMILSSLVTALIVSFIGIIGFVGLVVPHIVRKLIGGDERFLIPASCVFGGFLLLASDTVARTIISPMVLPVGVLTSFMGAPLFLYLVVKGREYW